MIPMTNPIHYVDTRRWKYRLHKDALSIIPIYPPADIETAFIRLTTKGELYIFHGYAWDGPSGPTVDSPSSMRGSLDHDALYQLMRLGLLDQQWRKAADMILEDLCEQDGMPPARAGLWRKMVNWFAGGAAEKGTEKQDQQTVVLTAP